MFIWYYHDALDNAFVIDTVLHIPSLFLRNMRCTECYWLVPGTESGCLICGSKSNTEHSHFTTDDGLIVPC